jgi:hypothetical protein
MPTETKIWHANQERFIAWLALPSAQRQPKTQRALAAELGVDEATLSDWKRLPGFIDAVNALARELVKHDIAEVLGVIRREAKKGSLPYVNMVLSMAGLADDIANAGKGPAQNAPPVIREVIVNLPDGKPVEP